MRESTQRLLVALLGLALICIVTAQSHWLMYELMLFWVPCCHILTRLIEPTVTVWLSLLTRIGIVIVLLIGIYYVLRRLWHSYRFLAGLNLASVLDPSVALPPQVISLCAELGLTQQIVVLPTNVPIAFCFGLLRPRICISMGLLAMLSDKEVKAVLLHERHHQRHFDPLRTLIVDGIAALLFFLPIVAELRDLFHTETELAADRYAIRTTGRAPLAGALHKLFTHSLVMQEFVIHRGINGLKAMEARLSYLLDDVPLRWRFSSHRLLMSTLFLLLFCLTLQLSTL
jgi:Zn-dependent protease with chaperone function